MTIENINILSTGGFAFFLLIILVGYIFVEALFINKYFGKYIFEKYDNHLFDRVVIYIFWGLILNIGFIWLTFEAGNLVNMSEIFNNSGELAEPLSFLGDPRKIQLVLFSVIYFIQLIVALIVLRILYYFIELSVKIADKLFSYVDIKKIKSIKFDKKLIGVGLIVLLSIVIGTVVSFSIAKIQL